MWLQRLTHYLLRHRWQALALTFISTFIPVIGIIGILYAAFITLVKGVVEGAIFTLASILPYIITFAITGTNESTSPSLVAWAAVGVAILSNVLTWIFAVMLRRKTSWSLILQIAALVGVLVISVIHLIYPGVTDWWGVELQSYYKQAAAVTTGVLKSGPSIPTEAQLEAISATKQYATGLMVAAILFNALLQLIVARWWQALIYNPGSLRRELHNIRLSTLAGLLFLVSFVLSYLGNSVVLDIMPVLYILFGAAGLSLIHYFFGLIRSPTKWFWMSVFYVALIIALPTSLFLISILALLDVWFDVRKRVRKV